MKSYIITIIGATILSSLGVMLTPESMKKYVSVITGFIIISCIVSPVAALTKTDIFSAFDEYQGGEENYERVYAQVLSDELRQRIENDIKELIRKEFNTNAQVSAEIFVDEDNNIKNISVIELEGVNLNQNAAKRLMEVYKVSEVIVNGHKFINEKSQKQE